MGILCLISEEGDGYRTSTDTLKGCLQTITLFIFLRAGTFFFFSHYFSLFQYPSSSPKHLYSTPLIFFLHSLSHSLWPFFSLFSLAGTYVCSLSIISNKLFSDWRFKPGEETQRLQTRLSWQSFSPATIN